MCCEELSFDELCCCGYCGGLEDFVLFGLLRRKAFCADGLVVGCGGLETLVFFGLLFGEAFRAFGFAAEARETVGTRRAGALGLLRGRGRRTGLPLDLDRRRAFNSPQTTKMPNTHPTVPLIATPGLPGVWRQESSAAALFHNALHRRTMVQQIGPQEARTEYPHEAAAAPEPHAPHGRERSERRSDLRGPQPQLQLTLGQIPAHPARARCRASRRLPRPYWGRRHAGCRRRCWLRSTGRRRGRSRWSRPT